ncbi:hypothetical protein C8A05DRAFT_34517 [Staphylotrichum tortipilum]|uniref:Uncharacterized protein n=1 Tax=Staphylotrichum tortipilum TaxID=2831512 RepID=A0AAN6MJN9_9PEZI|nr:hypothetical protein C8A05DRAFT_34517 [Staphylotrichum longicolle]
MRLKTRALAEREMKEPPIWSCGDSEAAYDSVEKIISCVYFLLVLGDHECVAANMLKDNQVCASGKAVITIYANPNPDGSYRRSKCMLWTIDYCTRPDMTFAVLVSCIGLSPTHTYGISKSGRP